MTKLVAVILVGATTAVLACSSSNSDSTGGPDGGNAEPAAPSDGGAKDTSTADSATETPDVAGECNAVTNGAPELTSSTIKGDAPAATGGTIADGTYFQKEFNIYDPAGTASAPSPSGLKVTLVIEGSSMQSVQELPDASVATFTETFVANGTKLDRTLTCPKATTDLKAVYSVSGSTLTIYETDPQSMLVAGNVYTKQ
ncbi:MAG: hypothetical protein JWP87_5292 [Labilithrix sp.]|nr:hypothetical protein [Labilithrix sp.]